MQRLINLCSNLRTIHTSLNIIAMMSYSSPLYTCSSPSNQYGDRFSQEYYPFCTDTGPSKKQQTKESRWIDDAIFATFMAVVILLGSSFVLAVTLLSIPEFAANILATSFSPLAWNLNKKAGLMWWSWRVPEWSSSSNSWNGYDQGFGSFF